MPRRPCLPHYAQGEWGRSSASGSPGGLSSPGSTAAPAQRPRALGPCDVPAGRPCPGGPGALVRHPACWHPSPGTPARVNGREAPGLCVPGKETSRVRRDGTSGWRDFGGGAPGQAGLHRLPLPSTHLGREGGRGPRGGGGSPGVLSAARAGRREVGAASAGSGGSRPQWAVREAQDPAGDPPRTA